MTPVNIIQIIHDEGLSHLHVKPLITTASIAETTGSLAFITWVKLPPPFSNIAATAA